MNFELLLSIFFPRSCVNCHGTLRSGAICESCFNAVSIASNLFCGECMAPLQNETILCHPDFPFIGGAAGLYKEEAIKALVHSLKFKGMRGSAAPLAAFITQYILNIRINISEYVLVPIPLSRKRYRTRGFNQSERIARGIADYLGISMEPSWIARAKHSKPQSETKSLFERKENIKGCFRIPAPARVRGKNIILIDDVITSGATFREAALALKAEGAGKIFAIAAARA